MSPAQQQQLYELQHKAKLLKGKDIPESIKALEARVITLEVKKILVAMRDYLKMNSPKLIAEIIQPSTNRESTSDRVK